MMLKKVSVLVRILMVLMMAQFFMPREVQAQTTGCTTSGPSSGAYSVRLCITAPLANAILTGNKTVTATVTVTGTNPGGTRLNFYLNSGYVLSDVSSPYTFTLPTTYYVDGSYSLQVEVKYSDGFTSQRASIPVTLKNGITTAPVNTNHFTPSKGTASGYPIVVAAVGDGAGPYPKRTDVSNLIASWNPNLFLYLGDVNEKGSRVEFYNWYGISTDYGRFKKITNPTAGNHDYGVSGAAGYFFYWDNIPKYYSYTIGNWHFISLNSTSQYNQTSTSSAQVQWLIKDLDANTTPCTLVVYHHPVLSIGPQGDTTRMNTIWSILASHGVELVLDGHDHSYQRWKPLNGSLSPNPAGTTEIVDGTGGQGVQSFTRSDSRVAASAVEYGALKLSLYSDRANYQFINLSGTIKDSGTVLCTRSSSGSTATPAPTLTKTPTSVSTTPPASTATKTPTPIPTMGRTNTFTFLPLVDAYVDSTYPSTNYGTRTTLRVDASPVVRSYLRFSVNGLSGTVAKATLRIYANSGSSTGFQVRSVSSTTWGETTITYSNAPSVSSTVTGSSGAVNAGAWSAVDVTPLVSGNGTISLALTTSGSTAISLASRESGANAPQLVVNTR